MASTLLTISEVSTEYRIPVSTLRWYRHRNEGPPSALIAGKVMYRKEEVDAWIDQQFAAAKVSA